MLARMSTVHARFARRLPRRVAALQQLVERARSAKAPEPARRARREAHKLAGTAGTYGRDDVCRAAQQLEHALDDESVVWPSVDAALDELVSTAYLGGDSPSSDIVEEVPRVLLVDDDSGTRDRAAELASRLLARLVWVPTLDQALPLVARGGWDAIIVDASTGSRDDPFIGARALRERAPGQRIPLAVSSADSSLATRVAASHAGADLFLPKPLSLGSLDEAVATLWARARAARPRVLALDDDPDFLDLIAAILSKDAIEMIAITDPDELLPALDEHEPHALLLDYGLPKYSGIELCAALRANRAHKELPILFVTGGAEPAQRLAAFEAGCDDYFLKPIVPVELCARVRARIERTAMMRAAADRDTLTGLPLRRVFVGNLETRISEAIRHNAPLSICVLDLDQFKQVNDVHGHLAGDRVLAQLGAMLSSRFRGEDLRGRWGGEEFVVAFPGEHAATMSAVLQRLLEELSAITFVGDDGSEFSVTFSAGIAELPADGVTVDDLVSAADKRLYRAKREGRARVEYPRYITH
jgi:diguanylate cyclase (GGDEF)-like protein